DAPLQTADTKTLAGPALEVPVVLGSDVVAYNLPTVKQPLKFDGPTVAGIFLGKITNWDDPAIGKLNPGVQLPNLPIKIANRANESGTTLIFTSWLSQESPEWAQKVGADKAVQWPCGSGGDGNQGVRAATGQPQG